MQFVKNGPDVPEQLLQAHEEGRVVFFCGAGVSYPAGLPGFSGLVRRIYDNLGEARTGVENAAFENGQYDTTIALLENRVVEGRSAVRHALADILTPNLALPGATKTHEALLTLAKSRTGHTRLITTNFDRLFEIGLTNLRIELNRFAAPLLPVPKKRWDGIVYLHGRLPETPEQSGLDRLVISSGDFGLAYLTERWAARFVSELFRNHTVCFVGYSINDPVMRYMMDALAADRLLGEARIEVFAFGNHVRGKEKEAEAEWAAKNVTPILYRNHDRHRLLHQTLHSWAETYRDGVRGKEAIIARYAALKPMGSTRQDNFVGRMLWALCDESGLPAKAMADHNPLPPFEWLTALADNRFGHRDLIRFGIRPDETEDKKLAYSLIARPAAYARSPWMQLVHHTDRAFTRWDNVMRHIASWLARHLDNPELLIWVANQGGCVDDNFRHFLESQLSDHPHSVAIATLWRIVLAGRLPDSTARLNLYSWIRRLKGTGLSPLVRMELRESLSPRVRIRPPFRLFTADEQNDDSSPDILRPDQLVEWEIVLSTEFVHSAFKELTKLQEWQAALPALLSDATGLLIDAMDLMRELQAANDRSDRSYWHQPSIADHPQNRRFHDWTALIELARDSWLATAESAPARAISESYHWFEISYPLFKRLAFFAWAERHDLFSAAKTIDFLISERAWWLWSIETHREAMRLIAALSPGLPKNESERLQQTILAGPPNDMYADDKEPQTLERVIERGIWLRLVAMQRAGGELSSQTMTYLTSLEQKYPEWKPEGERDEFPVWMGSDGLWRNYSATPLTAKQIVTWLLEHREEDEFRNEDDWRERCRNDPRRTSAALLHLAHRGEWIVHRWRQALDAWSDAELAPRLWPRLAEPLANAPDTLIDSLDHAIAWWLKAVCKFVGARRTEFFTLVWRVLGVPREEIDEDEHNAITIAINHPVGRVTEAVLDFWYLGGLEDNQGLHGEVVSVFTSLCDMTIPSFQHGRILLCMHAVTLFRVDRSWAIKFLLPQFDWQQSRHSALLAWTGFLWSPRLYRPFLEATKHQFIVTAHNYADLGEVSEQYAAFLTYIALDDGDTFTKAELREATEALPHDGLVRAAQTLVDALSGAANHRIEYWQNRVKPYLNSVWPKSQIRVSATISQKLSQLVIASGAAFPDALKALRGWLLAAEHPQYTLRLLSDAQLCDEFPQDALTFLGLIIPGQPIWGVEELRECLVEIRGAWPQAVEDPRFVRLETIVRQAGQAL